MNDLLGYEICTKIEKTSMEKLDKIFNPSGFNLEWDDRTSLLFSAFMAFYAVNTLKVNGRKDLEIHVFSPGGRMFLLAESKEENIYRNFDGERYHLVGATINAADEVMIIYADDIRSKLLVEYRPLLASAAKYRHDSLRYTMEKQFAFDYLSEILYSC